MTNASSLGTTSARRKTPRGFPLEGEGRRAPLARLIQLPRGARLGASFLDRRTPPLNDDGLQVCTTPDVKLRGPEGAQRL